MRIEGVNLVRILHQEKIYWNIQDKKEWQPLEYENKKFSLCSGCVALQSIIHDSNFINMKSSWPQALAKENEKLFP